MISGIATYRLSFLKSSNADAIRYLNLWTSSSLFSRFASNAAVFMKHCNLSSRTDPSQSRTPINPSLVMFNRSVQLWEDA